MRLLVILSPTGKWGTKTEYTKLLKNTIEEFRNLHLKQGQ